MTPELPRLIEESIRAQITYYGAVSALVAVIAAGLGAWLGAYLRGNGKNYATKDDLDQVLVPASSHHAPYRGDQGDCFW